MRREIRKALEVEQRRKAEGYRVIPLLVGVGPDALGYVVRRGAGGCENRGDGGRVE